MLGGGVQERDAETSGDGFPAQSSGCFAFTAIECSLFSTLREHDCSLRIKKWENARNPRN